MFGREMTCCTYDLTSYLGFADWIVFSITMAWFSPAYFQTQNRLELKRNMQRLKKNLYFSEKKANFM